MLIKGGVNALGGYLLIGASTRADRTLSLEGSGILLNIVSRVREGEVKMKTDLEHVRIKSLPEDGFYIADFITETEEEVLTQKVLTLPHHYCAGLVAN